MRHVLINSHHKSTRALSHILKSFDACPETHVHSFKIVIGGCPRDDWPRDARVVGAYAIRHVGAREYIYTDSDSIDFTALLAAIDLYGDRTDDEYFYVHDTCEVDARFLERMASLDMAGHATMSICRFPSMNIGLYTQRYLNAYGTETDRFRQTNKRKAIEMEDWFFRNDPSTAVIGCGTKHVHDQRDIYGTGVMRITEEFPDIGLKKFKANWRLRLDGDYQMCN